VLQPDLQGPFPVTKVVDGDTIWVATADGDVKVRLIGMDTAETVAPGEPVGCFGPEASARAKAVLTGASVYLELDSSQGRYDRYDRLLAYVWLDDERLFNLEMIRDGYAIEYTYDDAYIHQREFVAAQQVAQRKQAGMWSPQACGGPIAFQ
jgi:micrococcal nuclease